MFNRYPGNYTRRMIKLNVRIILRQLFSPKVNLSDRLVLTASNTLRLQKMSTHREISSLPCPFHTDDQLNSDLDASLDHLPGYPRIKLSDRKSLCRGMEW